MSGAKKKGHPTPRKSRARGPATTGGTDLLRGWKAIADYLAQPSSAVQRWAKEGMPVRRERRSVVADPEELNEWLGREARAPASVTIASSDEDLLADLRRGLSAVRKRKRR